jgi:hypothetical protein
MLRLSGICVPAVIAVAVASAQAPFAGFSAGNLVVSRSVYQGTASTVTVGQALPPNCPAGNKGCTTASVNGSYPGVWANEGPDASFGVTSPIFLDQLTTGGVLVNTLAIDPTQIVTSFPSKSEVALNLSTDGTKVTFMGYTSSASNSPGENALDVSNSNTPLVLDTTNPVGTSFNRAVAQVDASGNLQITLGNAYSGNNGRASILANGTYYTVGNSNNGSGTPANVVAAAGVQFLTPSTLPVASQGQGAATNQVGSFSVTQYGFTADKAGKDNNFRGLTIFNNTLYVTKGSGGNGINTVYQVGSSGSLPTTGTSWPITILNGFPTSLAKTAGPQSDYPFGIWFANANTLYVGDEGDGVAADAAGSTQAGLQKWVFNGTTWQLAYVLQNGLNLGQPYSVPGYPTSLNPATDGLRNLTGRLNADGTATIWAVTSTVSANVDEGADPNLLVMITDVVENTSAAAAAGEQFSIVKAAGFGEVLRGVSFTPGTTPNPAPPSLPVTSSSLAYSRASRTFNGTLTISNNTASAVTGPYSVELTNLPAGVTLTNGTTISGIPAVQLVAPGVMLNPGQSATGAISFSDPSVTTITFTPVVVQQ